MFCQSMWKTARHVSQEAGASKISAQQSNQKINSLSRTHDTAGFGLNAIVRIQAMPVREPYASLIQDLYQSGYAIHTIRSYGWHLHRLATWLQEERVKEPKQIEHKIMKR